MTAFQSTAFQSSAFQISAPVSVVGLRVNGFYVDNRGGAHYYYIRPDGSNGPLPPQ